MPVTSDRTTTAGAEIDTRDRVDFDDAVRRPRERG